MALNSLIGMELNKTTEVEDSIPSIVMNEELWNLDGCNRPELKMAYDQINIAKSSKKLTDSKYKPQLYVGIEGSYSSPGYNFKSDLDLIMLFMPNCRFLFSNGENGAMRNRHLLSKSVQLLIISIK